MSLNISPSRQTGVIVLIPRSVIRSSAMEPVINIVARSAYISLQRGGGGGAIADC